MHPQRGGAALWTPERTRRRRRPRLGVDEAFAEGGQPRAADRRSYVDFTDSRASSRGGDFRGPGRRVDRPAVAKVRAHCYGCAATDAALQAAHLLGLNTIVDSYF
jgi:hypothetical protein